ncbi:MAG: hypothetical protein KF787_07755 [Phycisphaeraceae bacterium]|mgnify:CR=1 FL=1|nr:hypothetical protein [Phycisphaerae bacterium]MBX3392527.1 hypothetical protein [Phycisphaeraceae bacterium]
MAEPPEFFNVSDQVQIDWESIKSKYGSITPDAFEFVRQGLSHTVQTIHGDVCGDDETRNVTGQQLCLGLREYAIKQYGLLARTVLERWGITRTDDFGRIVFAMVEIGLMRKTEDDRMEDFRGVYDFEEAFARLDGAVIP